MAEYFPFIKLAFFRVGNKEEDYMWVKIVKQSLSTPYFSKQNRPICIQLFEMVENMLVTLIKLEQSFYELRRLFTGSKTKLTKIRRYFTALRKEVP